MIKTLDKRKFEKKIMEKKIVRQSKYKHIHLIKDVDVKG